MPRYFFDFAVDSDSTRDEEGSELPNVDVARAEAVRTLVEMAKDIVTDDARLGLSVLIRDDDGHSIYEAEMSLDGRWLPKNSMAAGARGQIAF